MATGIEKNSQRATASTSEKVIEYEHFIDQQVDKTRFHVKLVDLSQSALTLTIAVLAALMLLVIVDHWLVGLVFWARLVAFVVIAAASVAYLVARVAPPLLRGINPVYAARTIERSFPAFKSALVNSLLFRSRREELRDVVYLGIEEQAAKGLSRVEVDSAVDRSPVIHLGYALALLVAVWCAYILLSPKSPLQTVQRVVFPWREISRPSEVEIHDVQPGDTTVFRGQSLQIVARIEGLDEDDLAVVEFSTRDGQIVNQEIPMRRDSAGTRFGVELSPTKNGFTQDTDYRIVAGDAATRLYHITAREAPHILVERVEYKFPAYTNLSAEVLVGEGDIRALEGTRVTVHGRANQSIQSGHIELLRTASSADQNDAGSAKPAPRVAPLQADGQLARATFGLALRPDRSTPLYSGYRLHFINTQDVASQQPVLHAIEVIPDLKPVVEILSPTLRTTEVPENGSQRIEIRALDPDFALTSVLLHARAKGGSLLEKELLRAETEADYSGQAVVTYDFRPQQFELQAGDVVQYWAVAEDNRVAPASGKPEPNRASTEKHVLRIAAPDPLAEAETEDEDDSSKNTDQQQQGQKQSQDRSDGKGGDSQAQEDANQDGGEGQEGQQGLGQQQGGGEAGEEQDQQGEGAGGSSGASGGDQQGEEGDDTQPAGQSGGEQGSERQPPDGQNGEDTGSDATPGSQDGQGGGSDAANDQDPLPSDGSRDGEVVERIREFMEKDSKDARDISGTPQKDADSDSATGDSGPGQPTDQSGDQTADDGSQPKAEDAQRPDSAGSKQPRPGEDNAGEAGSEQRDGQQSQPDSKGAEEDGTAPEDSGQPQSQRPSGGPSDQQPGQDVGGQKGQDGATGDAEGDPAESGDRDNSSNDDRGGDGSSPKANGKADGKGAADQAPSDRNATGTESEPGSQTPEPGDDASTNAHKSDEDKGSQASDGESPNKNVGDSDDTSSDESGDVQNQGDESGKPGEMKGGEGAEQRRPPAGQAGRDSKSSDSGQASSEGGDAKGTSSQEGTASGQQLKQSGEPGEDDPNLKYTQKATDLVLEYLRDQEQSPNPELLKDLGWNDKDLRSFLDRWKEMKNNAAQAGERGAQRKKELSDVLRSMGLRPPKNELRGSSGQSDLVRGMRDDGRQSRPPAEYADQYRAFLKSVIGGDR